jgi:dihydrodipicolinate synthase/N-acetylneuraminate lyase
MRFPGIIRAVTAAHDKRGHVQADGLIHYVDRLRAGGVLRFAAIVATGESASLALPEDELVRAHRRWRVVDSAALHAGQDSYQAPSPPPYDSPSTAGPPRASDQNPIPSR